METHFTSFSYRVASQVQLSMAKRFIQGQVAGFLKPIQS